MELTQTLKNALTIINSLDKMASKKIMEAWEPILISLVRNGTLDLKETLPVVEGGDSVLLKYPFANVMLKNAGGEPVSLALYKKCGFATLDWLKFLKEWDKDVLTGRTTKGNSLLVLIVSRERPDNADWWERVKFLLEEFPQELLHDNRHRNIFQILLGIQVESGTELAKLKNKTIQAALKKGFCFDMSEDSLNALYNIVDFEYFQNYLENGGDPHLVHKGLPVWEYLYQLHKKESPFRVRMDKYVRETGDVEMVKRAAVLTSQENLKIFKIHANTVGKAMKILRENVQFMDIKNDRGMSPMMHFLYGNAHIFDNLVKIKKYHKWLLEKDAMGRSVLLYSFLGYNRKNWASIMAFFKTNGHTFEKDIHGEGVFFQWMNIAKEMGTTKPNKGGYAFPVNGFFRNRAARQQLLEIFKDIAARDLSVLFGVAQEKEDEIANVLMQACHIKTDSTVSGEFTKRTSRTSEFATELLEVIKELPNFHEVGWSGNLEKAGFAMHIISEVMSLNDSYYGEVNPKRLLEIVEQWKSRGLELKDHREWLVPLLDSFGEYSKISKTIKPLLESIIEEEVLREISIQAPSPSRRNRL